MMAEEETETQDQEEETDPAIALLQAQIERERNERLRLEGENRQLREQGERGRQPQNQPRQLEDLSPAEVDAALAETEKDENITEAQRTRLLARLEGRRSFLQQQEKARQAEVVGRANKKIQEAISKHPELRDRNSPLMQKVGQELDVLQDQFGMGLDDPRTQALAIERALGPEKASDMANDQEYDRLRRGGGLGGGTPGGSETQSGRPPKNEPKSKGERIFNALLPVHQEFYVKLRGSKEAAIKTLNHADEAALRKAGRMT